VTKKKPHHYKKKSYMETATNIISGNLTKRFGKKGKPSRINFLVIAAISALLGGYLIYTSLAAAPVYYVDCAAGSDTANTGTSSSSPWRSLAKASTAPLQPGSQLLLKKGCSWSEVFNVGWNGTATSPITIGAYGDGELPVITSNVNGREMVAITGSYLNIENISAQGVAPKVDAACQNNPVGYIIGFSLKTGSNNNTIRNVKASGNYAGVSIKEGSHHNHVLNNQLINNTMMSPLDTSVDNDAGAFGVAVFGDDNEIAGNTINGQYACSYDYNGDGSAVEIYGGQRNNIHHNKAANNEAFTELGNIRSADNVYAYNQATSNITTSSFLITRGGTDNRYGPINGTKAYNNTVYFTGSSSNGIVCHGGCSTSILSAKNNILWAGGTALYADAPFDEGNNIFWRTGGSPSVNATVSSTSQKADPKFVNPTGGDFHLQLGSPAIDRGVNLGYKTDLDNGTVPSGAAPDIGPYEYGSNTSAVDDIDPTQSVLTAVPGNQQVALSWTESTDNVGVVRYQVYKNTTEYVTDLPATARNYTVTGLTNGQTYNFRVVAFDAAGNYKNSNIVAIAPTSGTPIGTSVCSTPAPFPSRLKTSGRNLIDENGCIVPKMKGFNMHAATTAGSSWTWPNSDYADIANNGGKVLRTVVIWSAYEAQQGVLNPTNLAALDTHIARAQRNGLYVILELHLNVGRVPSWATSGDDETDKYLIYGQNITQTLAQRYNVARTADGITINPKTVLGFSLNEPPQDGTTTNGNNSIPTFESTQRQMIRWFRQAGATNWIGFVTLAYANQKPYVNSPRISANPDAYDEVGGNVVFDAHDYLVYNDSTDPNTDSRQASGVLADTRYFNPGAHWLALADPHSFPSDLTLATRAKSQMKAYLKPFDTYATAANMPLMIGEFGWNGDTTGGTGKTAYYAAKREAIDSVRPVIETHWIYANSKTQDQWSAKTSATTWDPDVLAWLKSSDASVPTTGTDTTSPQVSITAPTANQSISGTFTFTANATDNVGVAGVQFKIDGANVGTEDTLAPYQYSRNTLSPTLSNGTHTVTAVARDAAGNVATAATVTFTVNNTDTIAPTFPSGAILNASAASSTQVNLSWTAATDNVGVVGYNILRNGVVIAQIGNVTSYNDTTVIASTQYTYNVQARDAAGNTSTNLTASAGTPGSTGGGWELVYQDDFNSLDTSSASPSSWYLYSGTGHAGNGLRQPGAISVANGILSITAKNIDSDGNGTLDKVSSGGMSNRMNMTYGKYEARVKTDADPSGIMSGVLLTWPGISDNNALYGENDYYETGTKAGTRNPFYSYIHWPNSPATSYQTQFTHNSDGTQWHRVVMEWTAEYINIKVYSSPDNGTETLVSDKTLRESDDPARDNIPDVAHHATIQLDAFSTALLGQNVVMQVDYIKAYKMSSIPPVTSGDTQAPIISITAPSANQEISGTYTFSANAADNIGVAGVQFKIDGANVGTEDTLAPYQYSRNTLSPVLSNGVHTVTAVARDAAGNVATAATITFTVNNQDTQAPTAPANLTGTATSPTNVNLNWTASTDTAPAGVTPSGVAKYNVLRNGIVIAQITTTQANCTGTDTSCTYTDTAALSGTNSSYTVQAVDGANNTSPSATSVNVGTPIPTDATAPSAPTNVSAQAVSTSQINLSWAGSTDTGGSGLAGYNIYRGTSGSSITTKINTSIVPTTSFGDAGLTAGTTYYYQIEAVDGAGNNTKSAPVNATTQTSSVQSAALGVYTGPAGVSSHDSFSTWLGRDATYAVDFADDSQTWDNIANYSDWLMDPWSTWTKAKPGRQLVVSLPMLNQASNGKLADGANGAYDQYFTTFAQEMVSKGLNNSVIRLGWEANGNWYPWSADPDPTTTTDTDTWKNYYRRIVRVMKTVPGQNFKFDLSYNLGTSGTTNTFENMYPGDDVVDIVGLDAYDYMYKNTTSPPEDRWNNLLYQPMGLNEFQAFASAHNKPMSIPEWGLWPKETGDGGGDNPYYIDRMAEWIKTNQGKVAYQSYFNHLSGGADGDHRLSSYPNSEIRYMAQFGATPPVTSGDTTKPTAPVLKATSGDKVAYLNWTAATDNVGVSKYEVWRDSTYVTTISSTTASSYNYTVNNLTNGTTYNFRVVAYDAAGNYINSNIVPVTPTTSIDITAPTTPTNVVATVASATQVNMTWAPSSDTSTGNSGIKGYNIYRNGSTTPLNGTTLATCTTSICSYGDGTAQPSSTYTYQVEAVDGANNKSLKASSNSVTTPVAPVPSKPGDITGPTGTPDGKVDIYDLSYIIRNYNTANTTADVTGPTGSKDGKVDIYDLSYIIRNYGK
jgi:hypothetical protein